MQTYDFGPMRIVPRRRRSIALAGKAGQGLALLITSPLTVLLCAIMALWVVIGGAVGLAVHLGRRVFGVAATR